MSSLTGKPVRVIRSWKCPSQFAPTQGYRYDGLYKVVVVSLFIFLSVLATDYIDFSVGQPKDAMERTSVVVD